MNQELKAKWVEALRSGRYSQDTGTLRSGYGFCCIGVLLDVSGFGEWDDSACVYTDRYGERHDCIGEMVTPVRLEIGLTDIEQTKLINMNDGHAATDERQHNFDEIADYIEATL